jgi:lysophospholipid acyltransferase (LPLAT)-like uncharacterized protein
MFRRESLDFSDPTTVSFRFMAKRKPSLGTRILNNLAAAVIPKLVRAYIGTCRIRTIGPDIRKGLGPHIAAALHGDFIPLTRLIGRDGYVALISRSRDGDLGSRIAINLGCRVVRGSSSSGGKEALQELVECARKGESPGIVMDGPRGPAGVAKPGVVVLSKRSGRPIVLFAVEAERSWRLKNWDKTLIPCPFTRIAFKVGGPITVPKDADWDECERSRKQLDHMIEKMHLELREYLCR